MTAAALVLAEGKTTGLPPLAFDDAVAWFRKRVPMTKDAWETLSADAKAQAFTVANVGQLDLVAEVQAAIAKALERGTDFAEFKKDVGAKLKKAWGGDVANPGHRLATIFRTNVQRAYGAGRWTQATAPAVRKLRPYLLFDAVGDHRTTAACKSLNGTIRPTSDGYWRSRIPPLHFACRSQLIPLRRTQAESMGITGDTDVPDVEADEGFGALPTDEPWQPSAADYPKALWTEYRAKADEGAE
jgi:SPP1 gp7 family putative phage head morphogenesis protein